MKFRFRNRNSDLENCNFGKVLRRSFIKAYNPSKFDKLE